MSSLHRGWVTSQLAHVVVGRFQFLVGCWLEATLSPRAFCIGQLTMWQLASSKQVTQEELRREGMEGVSMTKGTVSCD